MKLITMSIARKFPLFVLAGIMVASLHSCLDELEEDQQSSSSSTSSSSSKTSQIWKRQDGQSYLKLSGSSAYLCNATTFQEWTGSYSKSASEMTFTISGTKYTMPLEFKNGELFVTQKYSANNIEVQRYVAASKYVCDQSSSTGSGNNQGTTPTGTITFWARKDIGCGTINVAIASYGSKSITKYYTSSNPNCNASGCANFTNMKEGYYNYTITGPKGCKKSGQVRLAGSCAWVRLD